MKAPKLLYASIFCALLSFLRIDRVHAAPIKFAIIADAGYWNSKSREVRDSIQRAGIKELILPGDNFYKERYWGIGTYAKHWKNWLGFNFGVVAIGNHHDSYQKEMKFFHMPSEFYRRDYGDAVRFLVLNSDNTRTVDRQMKWLQKELEAEQVPAHTFLVWHHPSYSVTNRHFWWEKKGFQLRARELLQKYGQKITAVLVGHDHIAGSYQINRLPMILSGAIFQNRLSVPYNYHAEDGSYIQTEWLLREDVSAWARLEIDPETRRSEVAFIRAKNDALLFSRNLDLDRPAD